MRRRHLHPLALPLVLCVIPAVSAGWVEFQDETATRLVAAPEVGVDDVEEKSFAWGDVDQDGDDDLVVARKQPFDTPGKRTNVLFLNEDGVLTDRTAEFATDSDIVGDQGFLTPTNDRDIQLVDVDLDGWLDIVTAPAISDGDPKHIGHPRIYINQGEDETGWLGFRYEDSRIPALLSYTGEPGFNPRFTSVTAGDVNADGYPDLYFTDHDGPGNTPAGSDFNDKLLINQGDSHPGFFVDGTADAFEGLVPGTGQPFPVSGFGTSAAIADMNGDGAVDIVKLTSVGQLPTYIGIAYSDPNDEGFFDTSAVLSAAAPYYISVADLNNDDRMDVVITSEGSDRYLLNQDNNGAGQAKFQNYYFAHAHEGAGGPAGDEGFGGDNVVADLNNDGWDDVLVTDVTVQIPGCGRRLHIYRNLGSAPDGNVTLKEQTSGSQCQPFFQNLPSCIIAGIPASELTGSHDVAVLDIDGDGWKDLVLGRCTGLAVFLNQPPAPAGGVPDGHGVPGSPLAVDLGPNGDVKLTWDASCSIDDSDYEVYRGTLGHFYSHVPETCSTAGSTTASFPVAGNAYFLVVPSSGDREGFYGYDGNGSPRPQSTTPCLAQEVASCE